VRPETVCSAAAAGLAVAASLPQLLRRCYMPPLVHIIVLLIITNIGLSFLLVCTCINIVLFLALTYQYDSLKQYLHEMK
jgi:hypothetical protein